MHHARTQHLEPVVASPPSLGAAFPRTLDVDLGRRLPPVNGKCEARGKRGLHPPPPPWCRNRPRRTPQASISGSPWRCRGRWPALDLVEHGPYGSGRNRRGRRGPGRFTRQRGAYWASMLAGICTGAGLWVRNTCGGRSSPSARVHVERVPSRPARGGGRGMFSASKFVPVGLVSAAPSATVKPHVGEDGPLLPR